MRIDTDVAELAQGGQGVGPELLPPDVDRPHHLLADVESVRGDMSALQLSTHYGTTHVARSVLEYTVRTIHVSQSPANVEV